MLGPFELSVLFVVHGYRPVMDDSLPELRLVIIRAAGSGPAGGGQPVWG